MGIGSRIRPDSLLSQVAAAAWSCRRRRRPARLQPLPLKSIRSFLPAMSFALAGLAAASPCSAAPSATDALVWRELPALPDAEGFAGSFAGTAQGALLVAGGANFPGKRPWEGGTKIWHDRLFVLPAGASAWLPAGCLPAANGYGISLTLDVGVLLVGGGDAERNFAEVWLARWDGTGVRFTAWPSLPRPMAMAAGAQVGRLVFVAGGLDRPDAGTAQKIFLTLDLDRVAAGWRELPAWPGEERFLAVAGAHEGAFYLFGGARLVPAADGKAQRAWLRDAWCYRAESGWKRLADLPRVSVAAPSPAPVAAGRLLVLGGDDGAQVSTAPTEHRGFPRDTLAYDPRSDRWTRAGDVPFSLVTTPLAPGGDGIVVPGGEARPGVRSPKVWTAALPAGAGPAR